jgi:hypothetical protein
MEERGCNNFEYQKLGFFHICITDPNIKQLCQRIIDNGGKRCSEFWDPVKGKEYGLVYYKDLCGNIIEIFTHSFGQLITSR